MQEVTMTGNKDGVVNETGPRTSWVPDLSMPTAARFVGVGLILMFVLAIVAEFVAFSTVLVPGDAEASVENIRANGGLFAVGVGAYVVVLVLDVLVAWALYVVFRPVSRDLSMLSAGLRLVYTAAMFVSLGTLVLLRPQAYLYGQLIAYVFFITHVLTLGYLAYVSGYVHRFLGAFLIVASFCYVFLTYGEHLLSQGVYEAVMPVVMIPATFAELSLGIWLLVRAGRLPDLIEERASPTSRARA
jgi:hypothetical protein